MNKIKILIILLAVVSIGCEIKANKTKKPSIAFSFDDGNTEDILNYSGAVWNKMITDQLKKHKIQTVWFVSGAKMNNKKGAKLLKRWDLTGNFLANHTFNHHNFNDTSNTFSFYVNDIQRCDSLIKKYKNYQNIFRFPYLGNGTSIRKKDSLQNYFLTNKTKQGWVTIDAIDWHINSRLIENLKTNPKLDIKVYRDFYVNHTFEKARQYNELSIKLNNRQIKHTLLLHLNLTSALFLNDLIKKFKQEGWKIENYSTTIKDSIYEALPMVLAENQNLIWSLAKQNGGHDEALRLLAENEEYDKMKIDQLSLLSETVSDMRKKRTKQKNNLYGRQSISALDLSKPLVYSKKQ
jgi:peptidoglycan/xylan/chitin deacetylase (PgdA/CDA1 family)